MPTASSAARGGPRAWGRCADRTSTKTEQLYKEAKALLDSVRGTPTPPGAPRGAGPAPPTQVLLPHAFSGAVGGGRVVAAVTSIQHRIAEAITSFYDEGALLALCGLKFKVKPCVVLARPLMARNGR